MQMTREKRPLTPEEKAEKQRLRSLIESAKPDYRKKYGRNLTQTLLGQLVGELVNGEPMGQGAIWQYTSEKSNTKLNAATVQAIAAIAGFEPERVAERFAIKDHVKSAVLSTSRADIETMTAGLDNNDILAALSAWSDTIPKGLAMKIAHIFLTRASAD